MPELTAVRVPRPLATDQPVTHGPPLAPAAMLQGRAIIRTVDSGFSGVLGSSLSAGAAVGVPEQW
jgi:hypothetical protein